MNRVVLDRAVLDCAYVGTADVGGVGMVGALDEGEVQPYIKGHITDGSSTFTFKVNNADVTVPVDANGNWKWVVDRTITSVSNINKVNLDEITIIAEGDYSLTNLFRNANSLKFAKIRGCKDIGSAFPITTGEANLVSAEIHCSGATSINSAFYGQEKIQKIVITGNTESVINYTGFIGKCNNLEELQYPYIGRYSVNNNLSRIFEGLTNPKLHTIEIESINASINFSPFELLTEQSIVNIFNAVAADILLTFHQNVWNMIMREIDVQGSPIQVAYQNMIDNYDVTIANASFDAEIEYIEGTGTQWIDTNIKFKPTTVLETRFMEINIPENPANRTHIIGTHQGNTRYRLRRIEPDILYFLYGSNGESWRAVSNIKDKIIDIHFSTTTLKYKKDNNWVEKDVSNTEQFIESPDTITLFHSKNIDTDTNFEGRFYYLKIWDNGNLVADFIPVRKGTTGYLYDKVSGNLFGNSGTGDFILGNDK